MSEITESLPPPDLTMVGTNDMIQELGRRYDRLVVVAVRNGVGPGEGAVYVISRNVEDVSLYMHGTAELFDSGLTREIGEDDL